jgi:zinc/manganese transport system ATP-binding protein
LSRLLANSARLPNKALGLLYMAGGRAAKGPVDEIVQSDVLSALYGYRVETVRAHGRVFVVGGEDVEAALPEDHDHHRHRHAAEHDA